MPKKRIAAIEIGSNAPKMLIAQAGLNGKPKVIEPLRATLALGVDTYNTQLITEESMRELCEILLGFKEKLNEYMIEDYRVVATSAVREALNRDFVIHRIKQLTDFSCEIFSNSEERYLHNLVLSENFADYERLIEEGAIVLDLGAGSIQISSYEDGRRIMSQNAKLGYLRISELFSALQVRSVDFAQVMNEYIDSQLSSLEIEGLETDKNWNLIVVGNDLAYFRTFMGLTDEGTTYISKEAFMDRYQILLDSDSMDLSLHYQVPSDIAEILLPSAMIIFRFLQEYHMDGFYLPPMQLGEGILLEMAKKSFGYKINHNHDKDLLASVKRLAKRFAVDMDHVARMERDALAIHKALGKKSFVNKRSAFLLQLAVYLAEIGRYIHPNNYHIYSADIVEHAEFIGLSDRETEILAEAIHFIPGNDIPVDPNLEYHTYNFRLTVLQLSAVLRLVDAIEISRQDKLQDIRVRLHKSKLRISLETEEDLTLEQWSVSERSRLLEELFGVEVEVKKMLGKKI